MTTDQELRRLARHFNLVARAIHDADSPGVAPVLALVGEHHDLIITIRQPEGVTIDAIVPLVVKSFAWPVGLHTMVIGAKAWTTDDDSLVDDPDRPPMSSLADTDASIRTSILTTALDLLTGDGITAVGIAALDDSGLPTWIDAEADTAVTDEVVAEFKRYASETWKTDDGDEIGPLNSTERLTLIDALVYDFRDVLGGVVVFPGGGGIWDVVAS